MNINDPLLIGRLNSINKDDISNFLRLSLAGVEPETDDDRKSFANSIMKLAIVGFMVWADKKQWDLKISETAESQE